MIGGALRGVVRGLVTTLLPPACAGCGRVGREPFCPECAAAVEAAPPFEIEGVLVARALYVYGGPVSDAIHRLKYQGRTELGGVLGRALAELLPRLSGADVVVPVPLSAARLRARGYNQARELARPLPIEVRPRAIVRRPDVREQVGLSKRARFDNLEHAFFPGPQPVRGRSVLLLDDVVTTGATVRGASRALLEQGATSVTVLAVARTV